MIPNNVTTVKPFIVFLFLIVTMIYFSCDKSDNLKEYPFEAKVLGNNPDCGLFVIKITNDLDRVVDIVGTSVSDSIYIAKNLPVELQTAGLVILLDIRKPNASELGACTDRGPSYNLLYVTKAKLK
jgi:hypothetical protein